MKSKGKKLIVFLMAAVFAVTLLSACGAKTIAVTIVDQNTKTEVEANTKQTVQDVLTEAGISVGEKDSVSPSLDTKIDDTVTEIKIARYAKVSIVDGEKTVEVELVGGTVQEALNAAGFALGANDSIDAKTEDFLKDGMVITITRKLTISVEADGETKEAITGAATVGDLLKELSITLAEGDTVSPAADQPLKDGDKVVVSRYVAPQEAPQQYYEPAYQEPAYQEPQGRYEVSRIGYPNCADGSHGYYEVTYSDGSVEYIEY